MLRKLTKEHEKCEAEELSHIYPVGRVFFSEVAEAAPVEPHTQNPWKTSDWYKDVVKYISTQTLPEDLDDSERWVLWKKASLY